MTIQENMNKIKDIKASFVNGMITSDEMIELTMEITFDWAEKTLG